MSSRIKWCLLFSLLLTFVLCSQVGAASYTVRTGDSMQSIAADTGVSVKTIKELNDVKDDFLYVGQVLQLGNNPIPPSVYQVKEGETLSSIAQKYGLTIEGIQKLNNLSSETVYTNQVLVLGGFNVSRGAIDRDGTVGDGARYGELVEWFKEGRSLLPSGLSFTATDTETGVNINFVVLSSGNHCDVETATKADTDAMFSLFKKWQWTPRPVCIHVGDRDIAASLSGMPHTSIENIKDNGVTGHIDMYLYNSGPHGSGISQSYVQQHRNAVQKAAGN